MPNFSKFVGVVKAGRMLQTDIQTYRHTYRQRVSYRTIPFGRSKSCYCTWGNDISMLYTIGKEIFSSFLIWNQIFCSFTTKRGNPRFHRSLACLIRINHCIVELQFNWGVWERQSETEWDVPNVLKITYGWKGIEMFPIIPSPSWKTLTDLGVFLDLGPLPTQVHKPALVGPV